jgi:hypothetical protein
MSNINIPYSYHIIFRLCIFFVSFSTLDMATPSASFCPFHAEYYQPLIHRNPLPVNAEPPRNPAGPMPQGEIERIVKEAGIIDWKKTE